MIPAPMTTTSVVRSRCSEQEVRIERNKPSYCCGKEPSREAAKVACELDARTRDENTTGLIVRQSRHAASVHCSTNRPASDQCQTNGLSGSGRVQAALPAMNAHRSYRYGVTTKEMSLMGDPNVALVVVTSPFEAGGDRADPALRRATEILQGAGINLIAAPKVVQDVADASEVTRGWADQKIDLLVVVHSSWVEDSLQFQLQREAEAPVLLWTLPHPETYALAAVKHFA